MALSLENALNNTSSKKLVFTKCQFRKELTGWIEAGSTYPDIWYEAIADIVDVVSCNEDEVAMTEKSSLSALAAQDTSTVGAFFWDALAGLLYVKPKAESGTDVFSFLYVALVLLTFSKDGDDYGGLPYEARLSETPKAKLKVSEIFDGKVTPASTGNVKAQNTDRLFCRRDIEIDGEIELITAIEVSTGG
jgi:hypothetical protein